MIRKLALLLGVVLLAVVSAWALTKEKPVEAAFPMTIVDDEGVTTTVAAAPDTVASFAPFITETLFAIGSGDRIIAVSAAETYPPEATAITRAVSKDGLTPDVARLRQLAPDLVMSSGFKDAAWKTELRDAGIAVVTFEAHSVDDALNDLDVITRLMGQPKTALVSHMRKRVQSMRGSVNPTRPKVFFETFFPPLTGAGLSGFATDMVNTAGGAVVANAEHGEYVGWTLEQLRAKDPDIYLLPTSSPALASRPGFSQLRARVLTLDDELILRPGPRMVDGLDKMAAFFKLPAV
ncbi:MAG: helical backbone metal receptor [Actinomycetota bacterium]